MITRLALIAALLVATASPAMGGRPSEKAAADAEVRALVEAGLPADLAIIKVDAPSDLGADVEVRWKTAPKPGKNRVLVLSGPERSRRTRWVSVDLARKVAVTVTRRALPAGAVLTDADITVEDRPVTGALALDVQALVGLRIRKDLAAGAVLTESDVELGPPLARGAPVIVVIRTGTLAVSAPGRLEAAARVGDLVRVRVDATRRILSGRLTGAGTVTVSNSTQLGAR